MACAYLSKLRTDERLAKQREANAWKNKYGDKPKERSSNRNNTPFGNQTNPFGDMKGNNPFRS